MRSRHISTVIRRTAEAVYHYASNPANLPRWAAGLATAEVALDGDTLVVDSPTGTVRVRFAPPNPFGVLDHEVTLPDGTSVHNVLRVLPHPHGAEVVLSLRQLTDDDDEFEQDAATVATDLDRLRGLLEGPPAPGTGRSARSTAPPELRLATPEDAESLGGLLHEFNEEFDCPTPSAAAAAVRFRVLLQRADVFAVVARITGGDHAPGPDVGFAFLTLRPTPYWDGHLAQLEELYVRAVLRSSGIVTAIVEFATAEVRRRGGAEIHINVDSDDIGARRFYARHGYSDIDPDSGSGMRCFLRQL